MLGYAARAMGYRLVVLDPDPACPASAVADRVVVGSYADTAAALELAALSDVVTYELEHVDAALVEAVAARVPVRPGLRALRLTQDRLAERVFVASLGIATAPWREVATRDDLRAAAGALGFPLRLKAPFGGYDGRSQVRIASAPTSRTRWRASGGRPERRSSSRRSSTSRAECSVVVARGLDGAIAPFPVAANVHDAGVLATTVAPAPLPESVTAAATEIGGADRRRPRRHRGRHGGALRPPGRDARGQRAGAARPQQRSLDDRRGADQPVRAARPGDLRAPPRRPCGARAGGDGQPPRRDHQT